MSHWSSFWPAYEQYLPTNYTESKRSHSYLVSWQFSTFTWLSSLKKEKKIQIWTFEHRQTNVPKGEDKKWLKSCQVNTQVDEQDLNWLHPLKHFSIGSEDSFWKVRLLLWISKHNHGYNFTNTFRERFKDYLCHLDLQVFCHCKIPCIHSKSSRSHLPDGRSGVVVTSSHWILATFTCVAFTTHSDGRGK